MNDSRTPTVLIICDGWGVGPSDPDARRREGNAVALARTPVRDRLVAERPWCLLETSGEAVGLPAGQMGNSEVGHLNLGAGRIVHQDVTRISMAAQDGSLFEIEALRDLGAALKRSGGALHLIGLCSDGGVHSDISHLTALLGWARQGGIPARVHAVTDGRDTSPTSGLAWIEELEERARRGGCAIATVSGRYYAMDRDRRWERTERAYRAIAEGAGADAGGAGAGDAGRRRGGAAAYVAACYRAGITDEFLPPAVVGAEGRAGIGPADAVLFFNFRADRARQMAAALADPAFDRFDRPRGPCRRLVAMTRYEDDFAHPVLFPPRRMEGVLGEVLAARGRTQLRMAETEKYPHVTYFFNGGVEEPFPGEDRHMIPSPPVATYDLKPEMSAPELTEALLGRLREGRHDFVLVNYANADMVGHTGDIEAAVAAVETVDGCVGRVLDAVARAGGDALVTADHGNAERMLGEDGGPFTAHTTYPVRLILCRRAGAVRRGLRDGILADVAPTVLDLMKIGRPSEMTGRSLMRSPGE